MEFFVWPTRLAIRTGTHRFGSGSRRPSAPMTVQSAIKSACRSAMVVLVAFAIPVGVAASGSDSGVWRDDFEQAEREARQLGRPLLIHFYATWCGPCKEMDRKVLHDPVLLKQLRSGLIAVKVDSDRRRDVRDRFHIEMLPSDVFLDPNGSILHQSSKAKDRQTYLSLVARIEARFVQSQAAHVASQTRPATDELGLPARQTPAPIAPSPIVARETARRVGRPGARTGGGTGPIAAAIGSQSLERLKPLSMNGRRRPPGLKGFSPVSLAVRRQWVLGDQKFAGDYKGIVYLMASAEELTHFRESPERYAPQVLGCDPVILDVTDRAVPGDVRYAAYFEGELFLFVSDKSRQTFRLDPRRFVRTKHVLKVDELDDQRLE